MVAQLLRLFFRNMLIFEQSKEREKLYEARCDLVLSTP